MVLFLIGEFILKMVAQIIINSNVKNLNKLFDYSIPKEMEKDIYIGSRVLVPFGRNKSLQEGFVINFKDESSFELKQIEQIEKNKWPRDSEIELAKIMANRYFCNVSDCIKLMLPPGTTTRKIENRINDKKERFVSLKYDVGEIKELIQNQKIKSEKQKRVLEFLAENGEVSAVDLQLFADISNSIIKTLEKNGYIEIYEKEVERNPFIHKVIRKNNKLELTEEQKKAFERINESIVDNKYEEFLLYGITGSR